MCLLQHTMATYKQKSFINTIQHSVKLKSTIPTTISGCAIKLIDIHTLPNACASCVVSSINNQTKESGCLPTSLKFRVDKQKQLMIVTIEN